MRGKLIGLVQPSNQNLNGAWPGKEINQTHNFFLKKNCTSWNLVLLDLSTQPGCGMEAKYALSFDRLPFSLSPARQTRLFVEVRFKHLGRGILAIQTAQIQSAATVPRSLKPESAIFPNCAESACHWRGLWENIYIYEYVLYYGED
jgi:hypothetical protein